MFRLLLLYCLSITLISIDASYVPVKGGRHPIKPKEESATQADHHEVKHDQVIYPLIIENHDLTPKGLNNEKVGLETHNQDNSKKDINLTSILEDTNKSAVQEHNHQSTTFTGNREEERQLNQSKNDTTVSHAENHHIKNEHEEKHIFTEVKENFHHDQVTIRNQVIFKDAASINHNTQKDHAQNEHKISVNEDQHKVSISNLDGKNVEHRHNEHFLHVSNKDNPSNYHVEQHTSFDNVKIDDQQKVSRDHHSEKIDFKVPVLEGSLDVQAKVDNKEKISNLGNDHFNLFQGTGHQSSVGATFDNFNKNSNINIHDTAHKKHDDLFLGVGHSDGFESSLTNKEINNAHKQHDDKILNTHKILFHGNQHTDVHNDHIGITAGSNLYDQKHVLTEDKGHSYEDGSIFNNNKDLKDIKHIETSGHKTFLQGVEEELYYPVTFAGEPHDSFGKRYHSTFEDHRHYENGAGLGQDKHKNEHKILINDDQHKISISNVNDKSVEHHHNDHFLQVPNKNNPSTHQIEQHSSFGGVIINEQQKFAKDHNSGKVDIEVPFLTGTLDVHDKVDHDHKVNIHAHKDQNIGSISYGQKHDVAAEGKNHNYDSKTIFNVNKDFQDTRNIDVGKKDDRSLYSNEDKSLLGSVVGGTESGFLDSGSVEKNFNTQKPGHSFYHGTELHHHASFGHGPHDSFDKPHFEHHHPKLEGHHHGHHFHHQHKFEDSSEECGDKHDKVNHPPHFDHHHNYHHHHPHYHHSPHEFHDFQHSKQHVKGGHSY